MVYVVHVINTTAVISVILLFLFRGRAVRAHEHQRSEESDHPRISLNEALQQAHRLTCFRMQIVQCGAY